MNGHMTTILNYATIYISFLPVVWFGLALGASKSPSESAGFTEIAKDYKKTLKRVKGKEIQP